MFEKLLEEANRYADRQRELRRQIHRNPEIGLETFQTQKTICEELKNLGVSSFTKDWCKAEGASEGAGVVVDFGDGDGEVVLVRADMDALPLEENNEIEYASQHPGVMHACGHDSHTAVLLGVANLLKGKSIKGTIRLMFQPGEEMHMGCKIMMDEGVLMRGGKKVKSAFSMHVIPMFPVNTFVIKSGTLLASGTHFKAIFEGKGGHPGVPHLCRDVITAASSFVMMAQGLSSRETFESNCLNRGLVMFTQMKTYGSATNVVPDTAQLEGTIRAGTAETVRYLQRRLNEMGEAMKLTHRVDVKFEWLAHYPALVNDKDLAGRCTTLAEEASVMRLPKLESKEFLYALEDFSFISDEVPSVTVAMGVANVRSLQELAHFTPDKIKSLHSSSFTLEEDYMPRGSALFATLALTELNKLNST